MKEYKSTDVTGHAGEAYFSYWSTKYFGWICRLLDKDIGFDAKLEVVENFKSTGEFIFVQVKSTDVDDLSIGFKISTYQYWKSINMPVILVGISFETVKTGDCDENEEEITEDVVKMYWVHSNEERFIDKKIEELENEIQIKEQSKNKNKIIVAKAKDTTKAINIKNEGTELKPEHKYLFRALPDIMNFYRASEYIYQNTISQENDEKIGGDSFKQNFDNYHDGLENSIIVDEFVEKYPDTVKNLRACVIDTEYTNLKDYYDKDKMKEFDEKLTILKKNLKVSNDEIDETTREEIMKELRVEYNEERIQEFLK